MAAKTRELRTGVCGDLRRAWWKRAADLTMKALFMLAHRRHMVRGIPVVISDPQANIRAVLERLLSVTGTIADVDPRRWKKVLSNVRHIIVWPGDYTAFDRWGGVHLSTRYLMGASAGLVAGGLVHEGTHLRIARSGIRYQPEARARIEALCVKEQAAFLAQLPGDGPRWAEDALRDLEDPWWTEAARGERIDRVSAEAGLTARTAEVVKRLSKGA